MGGGLLMFLEPLSKCSGRFSYILLITLIPTTFVTVDDPTLLKHRVFVLEGHQEVFDVCASLEIGLVPHSCYISSSHSHSALCSMALLCKVSDWCSVRWYFYCCFYSGLVYSFSSSLYSVPMWDSSSVLFERCSSFYCSNCLLEHMVLAL